MPDWTMIPLQWLECQIAQWIASGLWALNQIWLLYAVMFYYLRYWLEHSLFDNLLTALFGPGNLETAWIGPSLGMAVLIGGVFILLRQAGIRHSPVDLRKAAMWVVGLGFLFANHSWVFSELESFRNSIASSAYETAGSISQAIMSGTYSSPGNELPNPHTGAITIPHLFAQTTAPYTNAGDVSALDLAAYSLSANQNDIVQMPLDHPPLPAAFNQTYYNNGDFFPLFPPADNGVRTHAVNKALLGSVLMFINVVPCIVAMIASGIAFGLSLTAIVLFCSLPLTLPFVFFEATEVMALSIIKAYLNLIVKTWIINLILSIFLGFNAYWAMSGNVAIFVTMSGITLYFCWQFQHLTRQTFYQALNTITTGIGAATGVRMIDPVRSAQQMAGRALQAGVSAAAIVATGGAAAPAVAGALLSSVGATGGGAALLYGATRHQKDPGEFARRGLLARQQSAIESLSPEEQRLATRAAAIQSGQEPGDRAWAANTLSQIGQRVQTRQASNAALRASLTQAGILPADEQAQKATEREQVGRSEQALGLDLRHAALAPAQMQEAIDAAAVLEGVITGNPAQAQATLTRLGTQARQNRATRQTLRATLTTAHVLTPDQDRERMQGLQSTLGVHPDQTHLSPDQLEEAITLAEGSLPVAGSAPTTGNTTDDGPADPLHALGAQATGGRTHTAAVRRRLVEAGVLPPAKGSQNGSKAGKNTPPPRNTTAPRPTPAAQNAHSTSVVTAAGGRAAARPGSSFPQEPDEDLGWGEPPPPRQVGSSPVAAEEDLGWDDTAPVAAHATTALPATQEAGTGTHNITGPVATIEAAQLAAPAADTRLSQPQPLRAHHAAQAAPAPVSAPGGPAVQPSSAPLAPAQPSTPPPAIPIARPDAVPTLPHTETGSVTMTAAEAPDADRDLIPPPLIAGAIAPASGMESGAPEPATGIAGGGEETPAGGSLTDPNEAEATATTTGAKKGRNPYYWAHRRGQEKQGLPVKRRSGKK